MPLREPGHPQGVPGLHVVYIKHPAAAFLACIWAPSSTILIVPADSTEALMSLSIKGAKLTGQEQRLTFSKTAVKTARKPLLWTGLCALGSDWTQGNRPLTSALLWHYWRGDIIFQVLHSIGCWKGQPPFTLYEHVSKRKVIPGVK